MTIDPNVFVFFGHGWETMTTKFKERKILPKGVTLVTFSECGIPTQLETMVPIVQKMTEEHLPTLSKIATDQSEETITAIQELLGKNIRVYTNGAKYPDLLYASLGTSVLRLARKDKSIGCPLNRVCTRHRSLYQRSLDGNTTKR